MSAHAFLHISDTTTQELANATVLRRVVVNTGVAAATVTVTDSNDAAVATIDAANPDIGRVYDAMVDGLKITLSDADLDVTVIYD